MLITNNKCRIWRFVRADHKSQPIFKDEKQEGCNVVNLRVEELNTSIRADTSGSQGRSTMRRAHFRLQLSPETTANFGSKVKLSNSPLNEVYKIVEIQPRFDAVGQLHHFQCDLEKF